MWQHLRRTVVRVGIVFALLAPSNVAHASSDRDRDPPPDLPSSQQLQERRKQGSENREVTTTAALPRRLSAYPKGDPRHVKSARFAEGVAVDLLNMASLDNSPINVVVLGAADGIPNSGIEYDLAVLPLDCQGVVEIPIDDPELALLRACIMREQIRELMNESSADIFWKRRVHDEKDIKRSGDAYRYVEVEAFR